MGDWTQTHLTYKTSAPLAALTLTSGQHFGEKAIVFSYPALVHRAGKTAGLPLRSGDKLCGERRRVGEGQHPVQFCTAVGCHL